MLRVMILKKLLAILLALALVLVPVPGNALFTTDSYKPERVISRQEAYGFADELKEMGSKKYDVENRLIIGADKKIDYLNAVSTATGIEGLYVLQFATADAAQKAYDYYNSQPYINYVEYDVRIDDALCGTDSDATKASSTQQYNMADRCQILDEKVIEVPDEIDSYSVEEIGKWCFTGNKVVEKIILPKSVKKIGKYAFANCPNLKEVIAPGVEECGIYAFDNCPSLVRVEMPKLTCANTGIFRKCKSLSNAELGNLDEIDNHAFYGCESLMELNSDIQKENWAINTFYNCNSLICPLSPHDYSFAACADGVVTYKCGDCGRTTERSTKYLQQHWSSALADKRKSSGLFDSYKQFDLVPDGIINGKDFAKINYKYR